MEFKTYRLLHCEYFRMFYRGMPRTVVVFGHAEQNVLPLIPQQKPFVLLVRDPRDVALSTVDYTGTFKEGVCWWAGLYQEVSLETWNELTLIEQLELILDDMGPRPFGQISNFEAAISLEQMATCTVVRYEDLHPQTASPDLMVNTLNTVRQVLGTEPLAPDQALSVIQQNVGQKTPTLHKGKTNRFLDEDPEVIEYLEKRLRPYIEYFGYELTNITATES